MAVNERVVVSDKALVQEVLSMDQLTSAERRKFESCLRLLENKGAAARLTRKGRGDIQDIFRRRQPDRTFQEGALTYRTAPERELTEGEIAQQRAELAASQARRAKRLAMLGVGLAVLSLGLQILGMVLK